MNNILGNKKGIVLIASYFVLVVLLGLSAFSFVRAITENRVARQNEYSLQAFYQAEAGIAYAYHELSQNGFEWYTHEDKDNYVDGDPASDTDSVGTIVNFTHPVPTSITGATISSQTGYGYEVSGWDFRVKSYPQKDDSGNYMRVVVILSQATVNGVTRTIEYRQSQQSAYEYFLFFSDDHIFDTGTYDARNFGGIHVNGDITLKNFPKFHYLTELSASGYIKQYQYPRRTGTDYFDTDYHPYPDYQGGDTPYPSSAADPTKLEYWMFTNSTDHYAWNGSSSSYWPTTKETQFKTGAVDVGVAVTLPYYLEGAEAYWEYDKYAGDPDPTDYTRHYEIDTTDLHNLATYEMVDGYEDNGYYTYFDLLSPTDTSITVPVGDGTNSFSGNERAIFETMYVDGTVTPAQWSSFWTDWKANHTGDYNQYPIGDENWERRFFAAAYDWQTHSTGLKPAYINLEWWDDMEYGSDRDDGDLEPAEDVKYNSDSYATPRYFLNTEEQASAWATWLSTNGLDEAGENKTLVQDRATAVDPANIIPQDYSGYVGIIQRAQNDGIYIGSGDSFATLNQLISAGCAEEKQFYNAQHPARDGTSYAPSNVIVIDVHGLKEWLPASFNGVVYVDLTDFTWTSNSVDADAEGVMLVNGEVLPDGGLSIVTPNNVFIRGNYNLDKEGHLNAEQTAIIGRLPDDDPGDADDGNFIQDYIIEEDSATKTYEHIDGSTYNLDWSDIDWQPAEIISNRAVYTLSEDFSEPQTMPLLGSLYYQYVDEDNESTDAAVIDHPYWGTDGADWMPSSTDTTWSATIDQWFNESSESRPTEWTTTWIETNWGTYSSSDSYVYSFDQGTPDIADDVHILRQDLKSALNSKVYSGYNTYYTYGNIDNTSNYEKANEVSQKHIYNTAIVSPYSTEGYNLELWDDATQRVINGAFIQMPTEYQEGIPVDSYQSSRRYDEPAKAFNYETRFGRNSTEATRPATGLTFAADSSWREIKDENFGQ